MFPHKNVSSTKVDMFLFFEFCFLFFPVIYVKYLKQYLVLNSIYWKYELKF